MKRAPKVQFQEPLENTIPPEPGDPRPGLMRMADARGAVPRKENESRADWKKRVFSFKRQEEAKHGVGGKGHQKGKKK